MSHDTTLRALGVDIAPLGDQGALQIIVTTGTLFPVGDGQAMPIPAGIYRIPFAKKHAVEIAEKMIEVANDLPDEKPKIDIAGSLNDSEIQRAQSAERQFRAAGS